VNAKGQKEELWEGEPNKKNAKKNIKKTQG